MAKRTGAGTLFQYGDGASPEGFKTIPQMKEIDFGGIKIDLEDTTTLDSPLLNGNVWRERTPTLADGGEITLNGLYDPTDTDQAAVFAEIDGKPHNFKIVVRDITQSPVVIQKTYTFAAFVNTWNPKFQVDKAMPVSFKFQITGPVTIA